MTIVVVEPGVATTVQDRGRPGLAHLGVPAGGAVDPALAAMVNRLVGNAAGAAVVETAGGLRVTVDRPVLVATDTETAARHLRPGDTVALAAGGDRRWHYLAVAGGVATPPVLGSRSHDTLSGIGVEPIVAGTRLAVGSPEGAPPAVDVAPLAPPHTTVRVGPGPRLDWFEPGSLGAMTGGEWSVVEVSRVGVRLRGVTIVRRDVAELASEGLVRGALQVPPDGDPVMMLADHPTTGGYPVIAVVHPDDVAHVAQCLPAANLRLRTGGPSGTGPEAARARRSGARTTSTPLRRP